MTLILSIIALITSLIFLGFCICNTFLAAPFVPSSRKTSRKMIDAADLKKDDIIYDLGSGDGRLVIMAARKGIKYAVGFEVNPLLNIFARIKAVLFRLPNTKFYTRSIWNADLSKCDKIFVYLLPKSMIKLEKKILEEMQEGSFIISHSFSFPSLKPIKEIDNKVRVYQIKKN